MANSYTQLYIHVIFAVKFRHRLLDKAWRSDIFRYTNTVISSTKCKPIAINGVDDHVHMLIGLHPTISVAQLMAKVKSNSSRVINEKFVIAGDFEWQEGYSAFSHSRSEIKRVAGYIENQEAHHAKQTFREEYMELLESFEVAYDPVHLFEFFD